MLKDYCPIGSSKYLDLKAGKIPPRVGDFVKSQLDPFFCGIIHKTDVHFNLSVSGVLINRPGVLWPEFLSYDDLVWIAPFEWDNLYEGEIGDGTQILSR